MGMCLQEVRDLSEKGQKLKVSDRSHALRLPHPNKASCNSADV